MKKIFKKEIFGLFLLLIGLLSFISILGYDPSEQPSGLEKNEIEQLDTKNILRDFGLSNSITSQRLNGFGNALQRIKESL